MKKMTAPKCMEYPQSVLHRYALAHDMTPDHDEYGNWGDMVTLPAATKDGHNVTIYARRDVMTGTLSNISVEH